MRTTNIRFTGLASGLDTESLVSSMVEPYKMKVEDAEKQQKLLELKQEAWKEMNTKIFSFYNDTLADLRLESSFNEKEITLSQSGVIDVDTNGSFPDGTHKITDVKLATGATVSTSQIGHEEDATLAEIFGEEWAGETLKVKVNGGEEQEIQLTKDMTLEDVAEKLESTGMSANYDEAAGAFFITSKSTGANQTISIASDNLEVLDKLGLAQKKDDGTLEGIDIKGTDASLKYNGIEVTSETNTVQVNGMSIKLISESKTDEEITIVSETNTEATKNMMINFIDKYNTLIDEITTKVDAPYNKDYLPLTDEEKEGMTDDEIALWEAKVEGSVLRNDSVLESIKDSMRSIISSSSVTVTENGKEVKYTLASFGITTSMDYNEGGKLIIDEEKLDEMLAKKPEVFQQLFTGRTDAETLAKEAYESMGADKPDTFEAYWADKTVKVQFEQKAMSQSGIGVRLYDDMSERLKGSTMKSSNFLFNDKYLDDLIDDQETEVDDLEDRMYAMEELYYSQFSAMEQMINDLNNQSSWLSSQLA